VSENDKEPPRRYRSFWERIGLFGPPLAAISILDRLDILVTFQKFIDKFIKLWHVWVANAWNSVLALFGISQITNIDAVFFTFFLMLILSFFTAFSVEDRKFTWKEKVYGYSAAIFGLLIISAIFTTADMATYSQDPSTYRQSIQNDIYNIYVSLLRPESIPATQYAAYLDALIVFVFYAVLSLLAFFLSFLIARLVGGRIQIWRLSRRLYLVIGFAAAMLLANEAALLIENYVDLS